MTHRGKLIKGFTLLEVIIAIAIFAVIGLTSFSIFDTVLKSDERSKDQSARMNELQKAFLIMERDINQIAKRGVRMNAEDVVDNFLRTENGNLLTQEEGLSFVRAGWTNPGYLIPRSEMQAVAYQLNDTVLERLHFNFVDAVIGTEPKVRPLITDVIELSFEYYDGKSWQESFDEEKLPYAIAVIIELEDYGVIRRQFLLAGEKFSLSNGAN